MNNVLRSIAMAAAFSFTLAVATPTAHAATVGTMAQDHDDHPGYRNNKYYSVGNREGYEDYKRKTQRPEHTHKYRKDDDRKAHDYGYQQGYQGRKDYRPR